MKTLDPGDIANKKQIKASITEAIFKQLVGSSRDEIALKVENEYERLLIGASILTHIPSLTAGVAEQGRAASGVSADAVPKLSLCAQGPLG